MTAPEAPRLLKLRAAAEAYSVSYDFLYEAVKAGDLPSIRPAGPFLVAPDDVMAFLRRRHDERAEVES